MGAPPTWVQDLVIRVALDEGRDDLPELTWRRRRIRLSARMKELLASRGRSLADWRRSHYLPTTGRTYVHQRRVVVTAGSDRRDQKLVLLHELAHWLNPPGEHHGPGFWDKAWALYRRYRVPIQYAKAREGNYRKGALAAYARSRPVS